MLFVGRSIPDLVPVLLRIEGSNVPPFLRIGGLRILVCIPRLGEIRAAPLASSFLKAQRWKKQPWRGSRRQPGARTSRHAWHETKTFVEANRSQPAIRMGFRRGCRGLVSQRRRHPPGVGHLRKHLRKAALGYGANGPTPVQATCLRQPGVNPNEERKSPPDWSCGGLSAVSGGGK